jgi:hypothetical protein
LAAFGGGADPALLLLASLEQPASAVTAASTASVAIVMRAAPAGRRARELRFRMPLGRRRGSVRLRPQITIRDRR